MKQVVIRSLPEAFKVIKEMNLSEDRDLDYRHGAREALKEVLEGRMTDRIDAHLEQMGSVGEADRRNGSFSRHLLTELGDIELCVPRVPAGSVRWRWFAATPDGWARWSV